MRSLPFDDESFDVVVSNYAFHYLDDPAKELAARPPFADARVDLLEQEAAMAVARRPAKYMGNGMVPYD